MSLPSYYDEVTLATFMHRTLGKTADILKLTDPVSYDEGVNNVILACGVDDIADEINLAKVRAFARREAWRTALHHTVTNFNFSVAGESYSREAVWKHCMEMFTMYSIDCLQFEDASDGSGGSGGSGTVEIVTIERSEDPYEYQPLISANQWAS